MLPGGGRALLLGTIWYFLINTIMFMSATATVELNYKEITTLRAEKNKLRHDINQKEEGRNSMSEAGERFFRWLHVSMAFLASGKGNNGKGGSSLSQ